MHEIITLQFGEFPNFVGTHFWNTQEAYFTYDDTLAQEEPEILHDVMFRTGITPRGIETYSPRLMIFDLKGGFGSLRKINHVYEDNSYLGYNPQEQILQEGEIWNSNIEPLIEVPYEKNEFLKNLETEENSAPSEKSFNMEGSVKMWSDFNRIYYHPKSIIEIPEYQFGHPSMPFDIFSYGCDAFAKNEKEHASFEENFRSFAEECDGIQGFHILTDILGGFGGFASSFLEQLRDEYPKSAIMTFGIAESQRWAPPKQARIYQKQVLNSAFSILHLTELSSLFIPLNTSVSSIVDTSHYTQPNHYLPYHSSATLSAAIETASLPFRSRRNFNSMTNLFSQINWLGNTNIGTLASAFPFPIGPYGGLDVADKLDQNNNLLEELSVKVNKGTAITLFGQSTVLRGIPDSFPLGLSGTPNSSNEIKNMIFERFGRTGGRYASWHTTKVSFPIPNSYPQFFRNLTENGYVDHSRESIQPVFSVPTMSRLSISTRPWHLLKKYNSTLRTIHFDMYPEFGHGARGLMGEDFIAMKETMHDLCDNYEED
ncbi:hypothetical protein G9A89_019044 [Geosiphon pyriformis]|nr:hypothetical protein G9A89_019044 [Geosiphon pyriformis]